eukprot:jgi/Astpho2/8810/fgenesh1_pg.00129_%23_12_t
MKAPTAYFMFMDQHRAAVKAELVQSDPAAKIGVAQVAKALGAKWRALDEAGRQPYKTAALAKAQELQAAAAAASTVQAAHQDAAAGSQEAAEGSQPGSSQGLDAADGEHAEPASQPAAETAEGCDQEGTAASTGHLPLSLVKRIMCLDPDVSRVSAEGLKAVVAATEHFLQRLAGQAAEAATAAKRSTIKFSVRVSTVLPADIQKAVQADRRLVEMGFRDMLLADSVFADARATSNKENGGPQKAGKPDPLEKAAENTRNIKSFFAAA